MESQITATATSAEISAFSSFNLDLNNPEEFFENLVLKGNTIKMEHDKITTTTKNGTTTTRETKSVTILPPGAKVTQSRKRSASGSPKSDKMVPAEELTPAQISELTCAFGDNCCAPSDFRAAVEYKCKKHGHAICGPCHDKQKRKEFKCPDEGCKEAKKSKWEKLE